jgi:hypothetical protein
LYMLDQLFKSGETTLKMMQLWIPKYSYYADFKIIHYKYFSTYLCKWGIQMFLVWTTKCSRLQMGINLSILLWVLPYFFQK